MKYIACCLFQSLFNGLIYGQNLNAVQNHPINREIDAETSWTLAECQKFRNSHLPKSAPECIYKGTVPEE